MPALGPSATLSWKLLPSCSPSTTTAFSTLQGEAKEILEEQRVEREELSAAEVQREEGRVRIVGGVKYWRRTPAEAVAQRDGGRAGVARSRKLVGNTPQIPHEHHELDFVASRASTSTTIQVQVCVWVGVGVCVGVGG